MSQKTYRRMTAKEAIKENHYPGIVRNMTDAQVEALTTATGLLGEAARAELEHREQQTNKEDTK